MHYALRNDRYTIETKEQVKTAADYFTTNLTRFSPSDRVEIATNMEKRANELNMNIDLPWVTNYSRFMKKEASYSPDFEFNMRQRKNFCNTYHKEVSVGGVMVKAAELVDKLVSEKNQTEPLKMVAAITELDKLAQLDLHYDSRIMDSIYTVYGSMNNPDYDLEKIADGNTCLITGKTLNKASKNKKFMSKISSLMGVKLANDFQSSPVDIFKSLPDHERQLFIDKIAEIVFQCSECGYKMEASDEEELEACPICGGKMELAEV